MTPCFDIPPAIAILVLVVSEHSCTTWLVGCNSGGLVRRQIFIGSPVMEWA